MNDMHPERKKKVFLSFPQRLATLHKLNEVCTKTTEGYARYANGWDDAKVASALGAPVNANHVKNIRQEMIGAVERHERKPDTANLEARITQIEEYLTRTDPSWKGLL